MGMAALLLCGTVNATSWRVCSKPEAGANFLSVADAVASNSVFAGDTLYVEPGHLELTDATVSKRLIIIGPGYNYTVNNINALNTEQAMFRGRITLESNGSLLLGTTHAAEVIISADNVTVSSCDIRSNVNVQCREGAVIRNCFINGEIYFGQSFCSNGAYYTTIANNIIMGKIRGTFNYPTIINNTIILKANVYDYHSMDMNQYSEYVVLRNINNGNIYNNILINNSEGFTTVANSDQTSDTLFWRELISAYIDEGTDFHNNIVSGKPRSDFHNCVFNVTVENALIWDNANTIEEKYKHKADSPAVGAGVNGTTCGAYGQVNGGRAYQPAGIPQYRPYIYDANIDETPSSNNTINASFKIKVQQ